MKKILLFAMSLVMLLSVVLGTFNTRMSLAGDVISEKYDFKSFKARTNDLTIGETHEVVFEAAVESYTIIKPVYLPVYDENGKLVTKLFDNGQNGDEVKGDGVYAASVELRENERQTISYYAEANGVRSENWDIIYFHMATDAELAAHDELWDKIRLMESQADSRNLSDRIITDAIFDFVNDSEIIEAVHWQHDYSFSFTFTSGITGVYTRWNAMNTNEDGVSANYDAVSRNAESMGAVMRGANPTWDNPDFVVFRPFRNTPSAGPFQNEFYTAIAQDVCDITGGVVVDLIENQAYPGNLLMLDEFGFFVVDSHGITATVNGVLNSYMVLRTGDTNTYDYSADMSAGHLVSESIGTGVTGSFFTKYFEREGKTLPGTMFYLVICYGMATDTLCQPLMDLGAQLVAGYDESVSFAYDFEMSEVVWQYMTAAYPDDPTRSYTFEESMIKAKERHGEEDPYTTVRAKMRYVGAGDFVLYAQPIAVESVAINPGTCDLYINNTIQLLLEVTPVDANRYEYEWSTSNANVATVDAQTGLVTAKKEGTASITCTVIDNAQDTAVVYDAVCTVNVLGVKPVSGIEVISPFIETYVGAEGARVEANVLPDIASNQKVLYTSSNPNVITVDDTGFVKPVGEGTAYVILSTEDGNFKGYCVCYVLGFDYDTAVNASGGRLVVANDEASPWAIDAADNRLSLKSTNSANMSKSSLTLNAGQLEAGSVLSFDWKASSELNWDVLSFKVNGASVGTVSDISGDTDWVSVSYTVETTGTYIFTWQYSKDNGGADNQDCGWVDNVDLKLPGTTYQAIFYDHDGSTILATKQVAHGEPAEAPQTPVHEGYVFIGWDTRIDAVRSDIEVTAIYTPEGDAFTVTFVDHDGTELAVVLVAPGGDVLPPEDPSREGYVFAGWDNDLTNITSDLVVTAIYRLIGDANGDEKVNTGDAALILQHVVSMKTLEGVSLKAADFNGDNSVNTGDAAAILLSLLKA